MRKKETMEITVDVEVVMSTRVKVVVPVSVEESRFDNEKSFDVDIKEEDILEAVKREGLPEKEGWNMGDIKIEY